MADDFLILGAGRFGRIAVERILRRRPSATLAVVDRRQAALDAIDDPRVKVAAADAISFLDERLSVAAPAFVIVPVIPVHVAFEWLLRRLGRALHVERSDAPDHLGLPNAAVGACGDLYASYADFLCPDDCPEPEEICPVTKAKRGTPMFLRIRELASPSLPVVCIRSEQIAPGVGGYSAASLLQLAEDVAERQGRVVVGTACRCHGVMSGLHIAASA